jgi:hypothetical protein
VRTHCHPLVRGAFLLILVLAGPTAAHGADAPHDAAAVRAEAAATRAEAAAARSEAAAERTERAVERLERVLDALERQAASRRR